MIESDGNDCKNILMVLQSDYPPDIRLTKEIKALTGRGHNLFLLCNNKALRQKKELLDDALIIRINRHKLFPAQLRTLFNIPLFFNPVWLWHIFLSIMKYKIDAVHVHDLPLALPAILIGKAFGLPTVFDMHENYPAAIRVWNRKGFVNRIVRNPILAEKLEAICLKLADRIIVVVEEHKTLLMQRGINPEKIVEVGNTVEHDYYSGIQIRQSIVEKYKDSFVLCYVGNLSPERDLETAIYALEFLKEKIDNLKLLLVGDGKIKTRLLEIASNEGVKDSLEFVGWVDFELTPSYVAASTVCIIPQPSNPLIDNGVPHKLYQYMVLGKPVVVSDAKALARIVTESSCGEVFKSHSPRDFADAVLRIHNSKNKYGENGKKAVIEKHNWANSSAALVKLYHEL